MLCRFLNDMHFSTVLRIRRNLLLKNIPAQKIGKSFKPYIHTRLYAQTATVEGQPVINSSNNFATRSVDNPRNTSTVAPANSEATAVREEEKELPEEAGEDSLHGNALPSASGSAASATSHKSRVQLRFTEPSHDRDYVETLYGIDNPSLHSKLTGSPAVVLAKYMNVYHGTTPKYETLEGRVTGNRVYRYVLSYLQSRAELMSVKNYRQGR